MEKSGILPLLASLGWSNYCGVRLVCVGRMRQVALQA